MSPEKAAREWEIFRGAPAYLFMAAWQICCFFAAVITLSGGTPVEPVNGVYKLATHGREIEVTRGLWEGMRFCQAGLVVSFVLIWVAGALCWLAKALKWRTYTAGASLSAAVATSALTSFAALAVADIIAGMARGW